MNLFSKRPLALVSLLFLLTSLFGYLLNANGMSRLFGFIPCVVFLLIAVLLALLRRKGRFLLPLCVAAVLLFGFLIQCLYDDVRHRPWREANAGTPHTLTGTVTERKAEDDEIVYTLSVTELDSRAVHLRLFLRAGSNAVPHSVGTHLQCDVTVLEQTDPFYYREGIAGTADALSVTAIGRKEQPILNAFTTLRTRLSDRIREGMNGEAAALTVALLLGEKEGLSGSLKNDFQRTGLSHMLALSGLHLSILAMLLLRLLEGLGTPRFVSFPLLILFL
ncbi:MAG: ComEC/Rec2 family competence protein, partial [Clostridia bacterium]|nr:ComEC/Rec2 family competence protein [Clostridia bacterium]